MELEFESQFEAIAQDMNASRANPTATLGYDVLADGLIWSDEYPASLPGRSKDFECVRILLRYRTSLLFGEPDEFFQRYWELAMRLFPRWAGFEPSRLRWSADLQSCYQRLQSQNMRLIDRLMGENEQGDEPGH